MAHDVFISYASNDKTIADAVCATLEKERIRCWIAPRDVPPGSDYRTRIVEAIGASRAFVLVFSANANRSRHVPREVEIALDAGKPVIPLRIEDVIPAGGLQYCLTNIHWLDALTQPLEDHIQRLVATLKAVFDGSVAPPGPAVAGGASRTTPSVSRTAGMAVAAAGVLVVLGLVGWLTFDRAPAAGPASEPVAATTHPGVEFSASTPALELPSRSSLFSCGIAPGFCAVNPTPGVRRIRFGESEKQLDRTIEGPLTARHIVPYRLGSEALVVQVEFDDGRRAVQQVALESGVGSQPWQSGRRLEAKAAGDGAGAPFLFVGYRIRDKALSYRPEPPPGVARVEYTFDEGGFFGVTKDGVGYGFEGPIADGPVRVRFVMPDGTERGPYEYRLTDAVTLALDVYKAALLARLDRHIWCTRITATMPMPVSAPRSIQDQEHRRQVQRMQSLRSELRSKKLAFVEQAPVIACRAGSLSRLGGLEDPSSWAAARELRLGTEPGQLDHVVSMAEPSDDEDLTAGAGEWNALLPAAATAVYAQVTFFDGTKSPETRLTLDEVDEPGLR